MSYLTLPALAAAMSLAAQPVSAEIGLEPLSDLTAENIGYQIQRCSAFYSAARSVFAEALSDTEDPLEMARFQDLRSRAQDNADGFLKASVIFLTVEEHKSDAAAVNSAEDARDGMATQYLYSWAETGSTLSTFIHNDLWANDMASCSALASQIVPLVQSLAGQ